jgi:hypothetical protein
METPVGKLLDVLMAAIAAAGTALTLGYVAHYDLGLSREQIRTPAMLGAAVIATLIAIGFSVRSCVSLNYGQAPVSAPR